MSVVVGYIPNEYGEAALNEGFAEAQRRGTGVIVVNTTRGDSLIDKKYVGEQGRQGVLLVVHSGHAVVEEPRARDT